MVLFMIVFGYGGIFVVYMYLLLMFSGMGYFISMIVILFIVYGVMVVIGNMIGGYFVNECLVKVLFVMFSL